MHWMDACLISKSGQCYRKSDKGLLIRNKIDGKVILLQISGDPIEAYPEEIEGFMDWIPLDE